MTDTDDKSAAPGTVESTASMTKGKDKTVESAVVAVGLLAFLGIMGYAAYKGKLVYGPGYGYGYGYGPYGYPPPPYYGPPPVVFNFGDEGW